MPFSFSRRVFLRWGPPGLAGLAPLARPSAVVAAPSLSLVLVTAAGTALENMSSGDLRQLFLGETVRDEANTKLVPLNQPAGSPEREHFDRRVLGMSPDEMARYWIDQKVRGLKGAPRNLSPPQMIARVVERFPGAVAYLRPEHVTSTLRAVKIDGRAPTAPQYALAAQGGK